MQIWIRIRVSKNADPIQKPWKTDLDPGLIFYHCNDKIKFYDMKMVRRKCSWIKMRILGLYEKWMTFIPDVFGGRLTICHTVLATHGQHRPKDLFIKKLDN